MSATRNLESRPVRIQTGTVTLEGNLTLPDQPIGIVLFAHGSGSSRHSPRNQYVARALQMAGIGTLLFDLLTETEEAAEAYTRHLRFNIPFLAERLVAAEEWVQRESDTQSFPIGMFGASTGAAAALVAAAQYPDPVRAIVSRGGRPDLAGDALEAVTAPTLLIVGGNDEPVIELNQQALARLRCQKEMVIVPGASHLFEEPGALDQVVRLAEEWFTRYLPRLQVVPESELEPKAA